MQARIFYSELGRWPLTTRNENKNLSHLNSKFQNDPNHDSLPLFIVLFPGLVGSQELEKEHVTDSAEKIWHLEKKLYLESNLEHKHY